MQEIVLKAKRGEGKLTLSLSRHGIVGLGFSSDTHWDASSRELEDRAPKYMYLDKYRGYWFSRNSYHWDKKGESSVEFTVDEIVKDLEDLGMVVSDELIKGQIDGK